MTQDISPPILDLILALAHGPQHGYALMLRIEAMHKGAYKPSPSVIYTNLQRLVDQGWAAEVAAPALGEDARRKHYQATSAGLSAARSYVASQQDRLRAASKLLGSAA